MSKLTIQAYAAEQKLGGGLKPETESETILFALSNISDFAKRLEQRLGSKVELICGPQPPNNASPSDDEKIPSPVSFVASVLVLADSINRGLRLIERATERLDGFIRETER